ncbi:hypothetical protein CL630_03550 [bacterium]|nr:hypothetical protein [bacterium]|tara:strand:+ start:7063 stop:7413 length:351 start_codon:yes stop_codon:yes gene_type:complete
MNAEKPPQIEEEPKDEYGWSDEELKMTLLYQDRYFDSPTSDGSSGTVKAAARWDSNRKVVIVRGVDGSIFYIRDVASQPSPNEASALHNAVSDDWTSWDLRRKDDPESIPDKSKLD